MNDHAGVGELRLIPVLGLPEFRPGDDLTAMLADAAPWLADGDVVVVTSKVLSKVEGRLVATPDDPEAREVLRRQLVESEAVRVLARRGRTLITEGRLGLVQAASGVDASNVDAHELALLPVNPDASAARLRTQLRDRLGVAVAVVVTDTMGRAWRVGQTDAAIGAAGLAVLHGYAGATDAHGNELVVTEVAVADEIAAAADLVKGKLGGVPVAVLRGYAAVDDGSTAAALIRGGEDDLFSLGTAEALAQGRGEALLRRRSLREFTDDAVDHAAVRRAVGMALTAPAPHHTAPVRFVWLRDRAVRVRLLDAMAQAWRDDLTADGLGEAAITRRIDRGSLLRTAPEVIVPCWVPDGAHSYPDPARQAAERTMFTVAAGAAVQALLVALATEDLGSCWIGSTIFTPRLVREQLDLPADWSPLGAVALGHPLEPLQARAPKNPDDGLLVR